MSSHTAPYRRKRTRKYNTHHKHLRMPHWLGAQRAKSNDKDSIAPKFSQRLRLSSAPSTPIGRQTAKFFQRFRTKMRTPQQLPDSLYKKIKGYMETPLLTQEVWSHAPDESLRKDIFAMFHDETKQHYNIWSYTKATRTAARQINDLREFCLANGIIDVFWWIEQHHTTNTDYIYRVAANDPVIQQIKELSAHA